MDYLQLLESQGLIGELSPKSRAILEELQRSEAVDTVLTKVKTALEAIEGLEVPEGGLLVTHNGGGILTVAPARAPKGNGKGAFGGGGGTKVKGPFYYQGGAYGNWHALAVATFGHKCKDGEKAGTSRCGYWTKALVELRDSGKVSTTPPPAPPTPSVEAPVEAPTPKAHKRGK